MKYFARAIITLAIILLEFLSRTFSFDFRVKIGKALSNAIMKLAHKRRRITLENLKNAFPEKSEKWLNETAKKAYHNIGITYLELLAQKSFSKSDIKKYIQYENIDLIKDVLSRGRGVLLMSAHFGNWELLAYSAGVYTGVPILIVVREQKYGDKRIALSRTRYGNEVVNKFGAGRSLIKKIREGGAIAILADQNPPQKEGIFIEFFGRETLTYKAPAELALKYNTPIVMGFAVRGEDNRYLVKLEEIKFDGLKNTPDGVKELTQRHMNVLEEQIKERPHLWAWQHRRWKNSPPVDSSIQNNLIDVK